MDQAEGRMLFLLQHPLRRRLLGLYVESEEPLSPKELADYVKAPLDHVACHVRVLASTTPWNWSRRGQRAGPSSTSTRRRDWSIRCRGRERFSDSRRPRD